MKDTSAATDIEFRADSVAKAMAELGVRVVHGIGRLDSRVAHYGGVTIAFRPTPDGTRLEISTAVCHPKEGFSRRIGRVRAVEALIRGDTILIPRINGVPDKIQAAHLAQSMTWPLSADWL